jgi:excisionase family DNA binding protein
MENQILYSMKLVELLEKIEQIIDRRLETLRPSKQEASEYITRKEVADILKITLPTLRDWTRLGWLKSYKIGTRVLYKRKEVEQAIEGLLTHKNKKGGVR